MKIGDRVTAIDEDVNGVIKEISGALITIVTMDGFELQYKKSEVVKIGEELKQFSGQNLTKALQEKELSSKKKNVVKSKKQIINDVSFDLHLEKLIKNTRSIQPFEALELQILTAERHIDFAIKNRIPKIVLIHGVGDGRLRAEIEYILKRYENIWYQEASFQQYGQGAIEIHFKQNARRSV